MRSKEATQRSLRNAEKTEEFEKCREKIAVAALEYAGVPV